MSKFFITSTLATLVCASLAAQTPTPASGQTTARPSAKTDTIVVQGCIQPSVNAVSATPDAVGTSGSVSTATAFILTSTMKPAGTSGSSDSSASPAASTYQLEVEDSKLIPHVGHKVEISGSLVERSASGVARSAGGAAPAPTLKVENVKMLDATCMP